MFTREDLNQLEGKGISPETAKEQLSRFEKGFPFLPIVEAATVGSGIHRFDSSTVEQLAARYDQKRQEKRVIKFVPASGAATRMFKDLFTHLQQDRCNSASQELLSKIGDFAFGESLLALCAEKGIDAGMGSALIDLLLSKEGLGYGTLPKALLLFHNYPDGPRTALEEHLSEGAMYGESANQQVFIHFTVSPEHIQAFETLARQAASRFEQATGKQFHIDYSFQKPSTDLLAANLQNEPFRNPDGSLLFRPGGHGALLENLNELEADLVFIKNIDNVVPDRLKPATVLYKKALAGLLLATQEEIFAMLQKLQGNNLACADLAKMVLWIGENLGVRPPATFFDFVPEKKREWLIQRLNRPIRVCGMVKNEGEPGGGPFWVKEPDGTTTLQIAESSQIDPENMEIMRNATHFNPVDLVCGLRDFRGRAFHLPDFRDPGTGFITEKSKDGQVLKAQELPGLWNGAMAFWNTIFLEVPIETFNPVKTVNDLLRPQHQ